MLRSQRLRVLPLQGFITYPRRTFRIATQTNVSIWSFDLRLTILILISPKFVNCGDLLRLIFSLSLHLTICLFLFPMEKKPRRGHWQLPSTNLPSPILSVLLSSGGGHLRLWEDCQIKGSCNLAKLMLPCIILDQHHGPWIFHWLLKGGFPPKKKLYVFHSASWWVISLPLHCVLFCKSVTAS